MKQNEIMKVKGFEFYEHVDVGCGEMPMHVLITFRKPRSFEEDIKGCMYMEVRIFFDTYEDLTWYSGECINIDLENDNELSAFANEYVNKNLCRDLKSVLHWMYYEHDDRLDEMADNFCLDIALLYRDIETNRFFN